MEKVAGFHLADKWTTADVSSCDAKKVRSRVHEISSDYWRPPCMLRKFRFLLSNNIEHCRLFCTLLCGLHLLSVASVSLWGPGLWRCGSTRLRSCSQGPGVAGLESDIWLSRRLLTSSRSVSDSFLLDLVLVFLDWTDGFWVFNRDSARTAMTDHK